MEAMDVLKLARLNVDEAKVLSIDPKDCPPLDDAVVLVEPVVEPLDHILQKELPCQVLVENHAASSFRCRMRKRLKALGIAA